METEEKGHENTTDAVILSCLVRDGILVEILFQGWECQLNVKWTGSKVRLGFETSLYQLSHKGSPRILEWVAFPFSSRSSQPRKSNQGLLHCRQILYQLSYQGSPNIKWLGSKVSLGFETSLWIFHFVMVGKVLDLSSPVMLFSFMRLLWGLTKLMHIRCLESASHNRMMAIITNSRGGKGCFKQVEHIYEKGQKCQSHDF